MAVVNADSDYRTHFIWPLVGVMILSALVGMLPWITAFGYFSGDKNLVTLKERLEILGTFGDMFGFLNATFSGIAFVAIYYTLRIQQKQHDIQMREYEMKKEIADLVVDDKDSLETFPIDVPGKNSDLCPANYVRIALKNEARTDAKNCRVMLTGIEKRKHGDSFSLIKESKTPLRLLQITDADNSPEEKTVTVSHNLPQYFNVCSLKEDPKGAPAYCLLQVAHRDSKYKSLGSKFDVNNEYKFYISINADNAIPLSVELVVSVGDQLEKLNVVSIKSERKRGKKVFAE